MIHHCCVASILAPSYELPFQMRLISFYIARVWDTARTAAGTCIEPKSKSYFGSTKSLKKIQLAMLHLPLPLIGISHANDACPTSCELILFPSSFDLFEAIFVPIYRRVLPQVCLLPTTHTTAHRDSIES